MPLSPSPVTDSDTYTGDLSSTPVSDSEDEPMPRAPHADNGWWQNDASWLAPIAEGPGGDDAQAVAEQREGEWDADWWHRQYLEENPLPYEPEEEEDPWTNSANWYWYYTLKDGIG